MGAKRWLALLTAIAMMFGSALFVDLWMSVVARVSGWTGLPQYESQIPNLQWYGTLWESLTIALLFSAAFVFGLGKRVAVDKVPETWGALAFNFMVRLGVSVLGVTGFVFLIGVVIPKFHTP